MSYLIEERRFSCNRIFRHLMFYHLKELSGKLIIRNLKNDKVWNFYFSQGKITWAYEKDYLWQRWQRQFLTVTGQKPQPNNFDWNVECPDFKQLRQLTENQKINADQIKKILQGTLEEILFDMVQAFEMPLYQSMRYAKCQTLLPLSALTGIGDNIQIEIKEGVEVDPDYHLSNRLFPAIQSLQKMVFKSWEKWVELGLSQVSPNEAPLLVKPEALRGYVSEKVYQNMLTLLQGKKSFRSLALKFKHGGNFLKIATILAPYIQQKSIALKVIDSQSSSAVPESSSQITLPQEKQSNLLLLLVELSVEKQEFLGKVAQEQGYNLQVIENSLEAIYQLAKTQKLKPHLIFATDQMSKISTVEFCRIIRETESLNQVPVLVYSNLFRMDKQAQDIFQAGATELINDKLFTPYHLNSIFRMYAGISCHDFVTAKAHHDHQELNCEKPTLVSY